jgi:hypothetical protein
MASFYVAGVCHATARLARVNSDIKPPLLVVDPERFNRPGEKTGIPLKIRNLVIGKAQVITIIQNA